MIARYPMRWTARDVETNAFSATCLIRQFTGPQLVTWSRFPRQLVDEVQPTRHTKRNVPLTTILILRGTSRRVRLVVRTTMVACRVQIQWPIFISLRDEEPDDPTGLSMRH
jgi:hypothetical protein